MRNLKYILIRLISNTVFALLLLKCFYTGSYYGVKLIGVNTWWMQLFCGISTALLFNCILALAKNTILLYLKHLQIASICIPGQNPNLTVFSRIKTVSIIVILNKILRALAKELIEALQTGSCSNIELFNELNNSFIVKGGKFVLTRCFDYMDECVLSYCYTHPDVSLGEAAEHAVVIFLENSGSLLVKTTTVCLTSAFLKFVIAIIEFLILIKSMPFTFLNLIFIYLIIHVSGFVVADSLVEPMMLENVVKEFCTYSIQNENNVGVLESIATVAQRFKTSLNV